MRYRQRYQDGMWVKGITWVALKKVNFTGWVVGYDGEYYDVYAMETGEVEKVKGYNMYELKKEDVHEDLINFTLDHGQEEWFRELTGGESSDNNKDKESHV